MKRSIIGLAVLAAMLVLPLAGRAQWVQTNGPYGGSVSEVKNFGSIQIALAEEGLFVSHDSGKSWQRLYNAPPNLYDPVTIGSTIIAVGNGGYTPYFARSLDSGASWTSYYGEGIDGVYPLAVSLVSSGNCLYVVAKDDVVPGATVIEISTDAGQTWSDPWDSTGLYPKGRIGKLFAVHADLFAVSDSGFYRSSDSGKSWLDVTQLFPKTATLVFPFDSEFFAVIDSGLMRSFDEGNTWNGANNGLGTANVKNILAFSQGWLAWTDSGIFESTNLGESWSYAGAGPAHSYALTAEGEAILAGAADSGIWRSSDLGKSWQTVGLNCAIVDHITGIDSTIFIATHTPEYRGELWRSGDGGATWRTALDSGFAEYLFNPLSCLAAIEGTLYATGSNLYRLATSTDLGNTWTPRIQMQQGIQLGTVETLVERNDTLYAGTDSRGIFSSTDTGRTWNLLDPDLFSFNLANKNICALAIVGSNLLAGTNDTGIFLSSDRGITWIQSNSLPSVDVYTLVTMGGYTFAGTEGGEYRSNDDGLTWTRNSTDFGGSRISTFATYRNFLFGASDYGIALSSDSGETWRNVIDNLPDSSLSELLISGSNLYAGTRGDGVWHRPLSDFESSSVLPPRPNPPIAITAYPNPATHATTIRFTTQESGYATITVINSLGAECARIYSGELPAGEHVFAWKVPAALPAGMFECIVRINGRTASVPIIFKE